MSLVITRTFSEFGNVRCSVRTVLVRSRNSFPGYLESITCPKSTILMKPVFYTISWRFHESCAIQRKIKRVVIGPRTVLRLGCFGTRGWIILLDAHNDCESQEAMGLRELLGARNDWNILSHQRVILDEGEHMERCSSTL
jgi:hypothetical protein